MDNFKSEFDDGNRFGCSLTISQSFKNIAYFFFKHPEKSHQTPNITENSIRFHFKKFRHTKTSKHTTQPYFSALETFTTTNLHFFPPHTNTILRPYTISSSAFITRHFVVGKMSVMRFSRTGQKPNFRETDGASGAALGRAHRDQPANLFTYTKSTVCLLRNDISRGWCVCVSGEIRWVARRGSCWGMWRLRVLVGVELSCLCVMSVRWAG